MSQAQEKTEAMQMTDEVERVAAQIIQSSAGVPHEVYMAALLESLHATASAFPCCAEQLGILMVDKGLSIQQQVRERAARVDAGKAPHAPASATIH